MRRHDFMLLVVMLLLLHLLFGCARDQSIAPPSEYDPLVQIGGITIDNKTPLDVLLTDAYSLSELTAWFPSCSYQEYLSFHYGEEMHFPTIKEVNARFPVQCLRWNYNRAYTVYKVQEGGFFYVFWGQVVPPEFRDIETSVDYALASFTAYLDRLPSLSDFSKITPGTSTGEDIHKIDPSAEWRFIVSSGPYSCSLLDDGKILTVYYERPAAVTIQRSDAEMVVSELAVYKLMGQGSCFGTILSKDYPKQ